MLPVVVAEAGEGVMNITLTDPMGHLVANQVVTPEPGILDVVFIPKVAGLHRGNVTFNCEKVPGMSNNIFFYVLGNIFYVLDNIFYV